MNQRNVTCYRSHLPYVTVAIGVFGILFFAALGDAEASEKDHDSSAGHHDEVTDRSHGQDKHDGEHGDGHRFFVGIKGSYIAAFGHGETHHLGGGGLFFELLVIPNWLEIELCARAMANNHLVSVPIDVLFKIPFHINETVHPFVGIGPTVVLQHSKDAETEVFFGGVLAAGSYFWFAESWAFIAELNYNLVYEHGIVNELGVNIGLAYGW